MSAEQHVAGQDEIIVRVPRVRPARLMMSSSRASQATARVSDSPSRRVTHRTVNFSVSHWDAAAAKRIAERAETLRREIYQRWVPGVDASSWGARCVIHAGADALRRQHTNHSARGLMSRQGQQYRVDLVVTDKHFDATLAHELTHVVLDKVYGKVPLWIPRAPRFWPKAGLSARALFASRSVQRRRWTGCFSPRRIPPICDGSMLIARL